MIGITLSPEQIRTAPPEVRHWIEKQMAATLGFLTGAARCPAGAGNVCDRMATRGELRGSGSGGRVTRAPDALSRTRSQPDFAGK